MVQRELESGPGAQRARFLGAARQNEAQSLKVSGEGNLAVLTGTGLSGVLGRKKKKSLKILMIGKHFCDKERASPYEKASAVKIPERCIWGLKFQLFLSSSPREAPPSLSRRPWSTCLRLGSCQPVSAPGRRRNLFSGPCGLRGEQSEEAN